MLHKTLPKSIINLFFLIGVFSAIAFRSLTIIDSLGSNLVRLVWYLAVIGYVIFFGFRFYISSKRRNAIIENKLIEKMDDVDCIAENDREEIKYLLNSIIKSKEIYNYLFIFVVSILAIALDIALH